MTDSKSAFDSERALMSVAAVTVAVRGRSARIAISPTNPPGPLVESSWPCAFVVRATPSTIR
jgi:hypothetical protein